MRTSNPINGCSQPAHDLLQALSFMSGRAREGAKHAEMGEEGEGGAVLYRSITRFLHHSSKLCGVQTTARWRQFLGLRVGGPSFTPTVLSSAIGQAEQ